MIKVDNYSFTYAGSDRPTLRNIDLEVKEGEFVLVVGLSGSGKSTMCRALNGLIPNFYGGEISGRVTIDGQDTRSVKTDKLSGTIGMVFQDPENQLVMTNVENELAFGMENMALPRKEMKERVLQYAEYFDLQKFMNRFIPELSGGEKQKVALASVIAMRPKYIVLDEPTSQLDEETAFLFLDFLEKLNKEHGVSIILVEHRLERCLRYASRLIYMKDGGIEKDGPKDEVVAYLRNCGIIADFNRCAIDEEIGDVVLSAQNLSFKYNKDNILIDLDLEVRQREMLAIVGSNGSGKSTLLKQFNGLLRPQKGTIVLLGKDISKSSTASLARDIGYLGQNPNNYLFEETLKKELEFTLRSLKIDEKEWPDRIDWALKVLNLERYKGSFPRDLSCGERERAALASVIVGRPKILVLDEPTRGLDYWNKMKMAAVLDSLREQGMTTIIVTHDYRFVAEHATRVLSMRGSRLVEISLDEVIGMADGTEILEA